MNIESWMGQPMATTPSLRRLQRAPRRLRALALRFPPPSKAALASASGYTLVELLVGLVWGGVILGVLGGSLLVAQLRVAATMQSSIETSDSVNRTIDLIRREVTYSGVLNTTFSASTATSPTTDCDDTLTSLSLIRGPTTICYKSLPLSALPTVYQNTFQGPCVLVRVGPAFLANGDLPVDGAVTSTVLMDGLWRNDRPTDCKAALAVSLGETSGQTTSKYRNADLTLYLANPGTVLVNGTPQTKPSSSYRFSASVPSNPAYGGYDLFAVANCSLDQGCDSMAPTSAHFKLNEGEAYQVIIPKNDPPKENILYLKYPYSHYTLQGTSGPGSSCSYSGCLLTRAGKQIEAYRIDSLVFTDQEVRPPS